MSAFGIATGGLIGSASGGRIRRFDPKTSGRSVGVEMLLDPPLPDWTPGSLMVWLNGKYLQSGGSGTYRGTRFAVNQGLTMDAYAFPPLAAFTEGTAHLTGVQSQALTLTWKGDRDTVRYEVYHSTTGTAGLKRVAIYQANKQIDVTNETANGAEIAVTGVDGIGEAGHTYTLTLNFAAGAVTATAVDQDTLREWGPETRDSLEDVFGNAHFQFGVGLSVEIPDVDNWNYPGDTEFTIETGPLRSYQAINAGDNASHTFLVQAFRGDGSPGVPSSEALFTLDPLPNPVEDLAVEFVSAGAVDVTFTMPEDANIAEYHLYHSLPDIEDYDIVFPIPFATGAAAPEEEVTVHLTGLEAGRYTLLVRAVNDEGQDDHSDSSIVFYLSATSVSFQDIDKPADFQVIPDGIGQVKIAFRTNGAEDLVALYTNGGVEGDPVDYDNPWLFVPDDERNENNRYEVSAHGLSAGTWRIAGRCRLLGSEEGNTESVDEATIYEAPLSIPHDLEVAAS